MKRQRSPHMSPEMRAMRAGLTAYWANNALGATARAVAYAEAAGLPPRTIAALLRAKRALDAANTSAETHRQQFIRKAEREEQKA